MKSRSFGKIGSLFCLVSTMGCTSASFNSSAIPVETTSTRSTMNSATSNATSNEQAPINLSSENRRLIGQKIWQNEAGGTIAGLTHWNKSEGFASLGIGHFIWFPEGKDFIFKESFPSLITYMQSRGKKVPHWLIDSACPWSDLADFNAAKNSKQMRELRDFLAGSIELQLDFIVQRSQQSLAKMQNISTKQESRKLATNYYAVAKSARGLYALIDYVNFKGEGIKPSERYNGQGWGLRDVLLAMPLQSGSPAAAIAFSKAAKSMLQRRVNNGPKSEAAWLKNWLNRCGSYAKPLT